MLRRLSAVRFRYRLAAWLVPATILTATAARGEVITLKSGIQIQGRLVKLSSLNQNPLSQAKASTGNVDVTKIVSMDDGLRRTFFSTNMIRTNGLAADEQGLSFEKLVVDKRIAQGGKHIGIVGPILGVSRWDDAGNRVFTMQSSQGPLDVIQGITLVTPVYTKVEGLQVKNGIVWDMRLATSSFPREMLSPLLKRQIDVKDPRERLQIMTLYLQSKRYRDALVELEEIMADFPDLKQLAEQRTRLYQLVAEDVIREIELRREAGQHLHAYALLKNFPAQDVAGEMLIKVRDLLDEYEKIQDQGKKVIDDLAAHVKELAGRKDHGQLEAIQQEIATELNIHTLDRMADYVHLASDAQMKTDQKVALAISGWLMGPGGAKDNLAEAVSLYEVRNVVREYLRTAEQPPRAELLKRLESLEGASPGNVARLIAYMRPPLEPDLSQLDPSGTVELSAANVWPDEEVHYTVQLPPEYNPYRRYPCVVTLHGGGSTPADQISWWSGEYDAQKQTRTGQASRMGYIVIAPAWAPPGKYSYAYSLREHAFVLGALRDACRRFSIDTDRVFLSGHAMGGDAAWDIGLAHPDLWAGVIPITATAGKYVLHYWPNGRGLPMYFVAGELDGTKIVDNAPVLDRYMKYAGFEALYVEYLGRGNEHFHDEIQRIFEWMGRQRRNFFPPEFNVVTMRPWDKFFWWVELDKFPERSLAFPESWPPKKPNAADTKARYYLNNNINVHSAADQVTVWLSPEMVNFDQTVTVNGQKAPPPSVEVVLEDVRTRGDRQHPFWSKQVVR